MAEALTREFTKFRDLPDAQKRLTVAVAGFGPPGPFMATVSNQEDDCGTMLASVAERFRVSWIFRNERKMKRLDLVFHGAEAAIDEDLKKAIAKVRRALFLKSGNSIASALVALVRHAAKHPKYGHLISPNCISMIHANGWYQIECDDHIVGKRRKTHLPHFVSPFGAYKHCWIQDE
jgi:hypothetical protein